MRLSPRQLQLSHTVTNPPLAPSRRGFTVTEMIIVVSLITIITAMVMPKVNYVAYRVDVGARAVRVALQKAQAYAVSSQHNELVAVDAANGMLYVVDDVNNNLAADPGERVVGTPMQDGVVFATPPSTWPSAPTASGPITGTSLATITVNGATLPGFVFRCDGAASSDVQIYLTSRRGLTNDFRGVDVTQATGRVDWYKDLGGTWTLAGF